MKPRTTQTSVRIPKASSMKKGGNFRCRPEPTTAKRQARPLSTRSRSSLPALKCGTYFSGTLTLSPDFGFLPVRGGR